MLTGEYKGQPMLVHLPMKEVKEQDFDVWLGLFRQTLEELSGSQKTVAYFMERAERIAQSLQLALFGIPGLSRAQRS